MDRVYKKKGQMDNYRWHVWATQIGHKWKYRNGFKWGIGYDIHSPRKGYMGR